MRSVQSDVQRLRAQMDEMQQRFNASPAHLGRINDVQHSTETQTHDSWSSPPRSVAQPDQISYAQPHGIGSSKHPNDFMARVSSGHPTIVGTTSAPWTGQEEVQEAFSSSEEMIDDPLIELATMAPLGKMVTQTEASRNQNTGRWNDDVRDDQAQTGGSGSIERADWTYPHLGIRGRFGQESDVSLGDLMTGKKSCELFER